MEADAEVEACGPKAEVDALPASVAMIDCYDAQRKGD